MAEQAEQPKPKDKRRTPDATGPELFAAWIDAGTPKYREFATVLHNQGRYKSVATAFSSICAYSGRDKWQDRKANALDEAAEAKLKEAATIDADSFLRSSKVINDRLKMATREHADVIVKMRESVRRPTVKTTTDVNVKHTGTVTHNHRDLSMFTDDEIASMAALAERRKAERV